MRERSLVVAALTFVADWTIASCGSVVRSCRACGAIWAQGPNHGVARAAGLVVWRDADAQLQGRGQARNPALLELADQALYRAKQSGRNRALPAS